MTGRENRRAPRVGEGVTDQVLDVHCVEVEHVECHREPAAAATSSDTLVTSRSAGEQELQFDGTVGADVPKRLQAESGFHREQHREVDIRRERGHERTDEFLGAAELVRERCGACAARAHDPVDVAHTEFEAAKATLRGSSARSRRLADRKKG